MAPKFIIPKHNIKHWITVLDYIFTWNKNKDLVLLIFDGQQNDRSKLSHFMIMHPFALNFVADGRNPDLTKYLTITAVFLPPLTSKRCRRIVRELSPDNNYIGLHWNKKSGGLERAVISVNNLWRFGYFAFKKMIDIQLFTESVGNQGFVELLEMSSWDYIEKTDFGRFSSSSERQTAVCSH